VRRFGFILLLWVCATSYVRAAVAERSRAETTYSLADPALHDLQRYLRPTLEANRKVFTGATGGVHGLGAGAAYPQIWLRDSATLLPLARYLFPREVLESWLEEHLAHQQDRGDLFDWIAPGEASHFTRDAPRAREVFRAGPLVLSADRNTTENDQEASAVDAAAQVFAITGDLRWLRKLIRGRPLLDRLDRALEATHVLRFDHARGLATSAFTADWGDVSPVYGDQRVIYLDEATPVVAGLYTNALQYRAARALAVMLRADGNRPRAAHWERRAEALRAAANRQLWREGPGFYRMHLPVAGPPAPFDDTDVFALGGNALAALYGLADPHRAARIFAVAEERRRAYGLSTIAAVLLPPYPRGVFRHPILTQPFTYQNGGQWDWFAGRFVLAEFEHGHAQAARRHLREIAERAARAGGLFEWNTREGAGRGSATYAGSAGALGAALLQGLFGIDLRATGLALHVRLGDQAGQVRVYQPATDTFVQYQYRPRPDRLWLSFSSNATGRGELAVLLPAGAEVSGARLDGRPIATRSRTVGHDRYLLTVTDWRRHTLEVLLRPGAELRRPDTAS
jgi:hypothetical protein